MSFDHQTLQAPKTSVHNNFYKVSFSLNFFDMFSCGGVAGVHWAERRKTTLRKKEADLGDLHHLFSGQWRQPLVAPTWRAENPLCGMETAPRTSWRRLTLARRRGHPLFCWRRSRSEASVEAAPWRASQRTAGEVASRCCFRVIWEIGEPVCECDIEAEE